MFFRVSRVFGESRVVVSRGGAQLAVYKRVHMVPGEMEQIILPEKLLGGSFGEITISCEEAAH